LTHGKQIEMSGAIAIRKPADATAMSVMAVPCLVWSLNYVVVKLAEPDVSLVMQSGIRAAVAALLLLLWARVRGIRLFNHDGTLGLGLLAGALFAGEFLFI
jgi:drug/metabolite transporter (DMT)-like permease